MSRNTIRLTAVVQLCLILFTGCQPTKPFYMANNQSMANYIDQAMALDYADVHVESLPEATQAHIPFGPTNLPSGFIELSLEDCISIALQNTKIIRVVNGSNRQSGPVSASLLSAPAGSMPSVYDPAIAATSGSTQPLTIDSQGNRVAPRGSTRANQVASVEDALAEFDAQFSMIAGYNTTDRPRNVGRGNVFNPQFFQAFDGNFQSALSKRLATGTIATARFTTVYSRNNIPASGNALGSTNFGRSVPSDYTAAIELQLTQPLMRGRGTLVNRIPVILARINEDIAVHDFEANIRNLVRDVEHAYWDLYSGYRSVEAARDALERATTHWRVVNARAETTDTPPEAVAQAAVQVKQFQVRAKVAMNGTRVPGAGDPLGLYGREQILREKMGWSPTDGRMIRPSDEPTLALVQFDWAEVLGEGLTRNVDLRRHKWTIKQRELELVSARNQILPQLDLVGTYRFLGVGDEFANADRNGLAFPNPGSTAIEELTGGDYQEVGARLEYTPQAFGKRRALNNIQNARLAIQKGLEELREKELAMVHELGAEWRLMEGQFVEFQDYGEQLVEQEKEIRIYNDKIEGDTGEIAQLLDLLLRAEERKAQVQVLYYRAICEYNKSLVNMHYIKGSILDLNSISLGEGAWVEKAYWDADERARERAAGTYIDYGYTRPSVVSLGPAEAGGITEGNISDQGPFSDGEPTTAEEIAPAAPEAGEGESGEANTPVATRTGGTVRTASAEQFNWGDLGMEEGQPQARKPSIQQPAGAVRIQPTGQWQQR